MQIKIIPNDKGNPVGKLADAELHFPVCAHCDTTNPAAHRYPDCECQPLAGLKLIGFSIWERRGGSGRNVTFPARQYSVNGERRSFALLRPAGLDSQAQNRIRDLILQAYEEYETRETRDQGMQAAQVTKAPDPRQNPGDHGYAAPRTGEACVYCGQGPNAPTHTSKITPSEPPSIKALIERKEREVRNNFEF